MSHDPDREWELARCEAIDRIYAILYQDGPDTQWDADTVDAIDKVIAEVLRNEPTYRITPEGLAYLAALPVPDEEPSGPPVCPHCGSDRIVEVGSTEYEQVIVTIGFCDGFRTVTDFGEREDFVEQDEFRHYECKDCEIENTDLSAFAKGSDLWMKLHEESKSVLPL